MLWVLLPWCECQMGVGLHRAVLVVRLAPPRLTVPLRLPSSPICGSAAKESDRLALEARVKVLEGDNAKLAATAEASKAEAEGARREAAAYRRQARKLQKAAEAAEAAAAGAAGAGGEGGSAQAVAELLQKRVKVRASKEDNFPGIAAAAPVADLPIAASLPVEVCGRTQSPLH